MAENFDPTQLTPEFEDQEEFTLFHIAQLGEDARKFFASDPGFYILGRAKEVIDECSRQLLTIPAWRRRKIQQIQNRAASARMLVQFVDEMFSNGDIAYKNLAAREEKD